MFLSGRVEEGDAAVGEVEGGGGEGAGDELLPEGSCLVTDVLHDDATVGVEKVVVKVVLQLGDVFAVVVTDSELIAFVFKVIDQVGFGGGVFGMCHYILRFQPTADFEELLIGRSAAQFVEGIEAVSVEQHVGDELKSPGRLDVESVAVPPAAGP